MPQPNSSAPMRHRMSLLRRALGIVATVLIVFAIIELSMRHVQPDGLLYQEVARSSQSQPFTKVIYTARFAAADGDQETIDAWYSAFQTAEVIQGGRTCAEAQAYNQTHVEHRFTFTWHGIVVAYMHDEGCDEYNVSSGGLVNPFVFQGLAVNPRMYPHAKKPVPLLPPDPTSAPQQ